MAEGSTSQGTSRDVNIMRCLGLRNSYISVATLSYSIIKSLEAVVVTSHNCPRIHNHELVPGFRFGNWASRPKFPNLTVVHQ